ncbi:Sigma-54 interacting regulator [uncultured Desulfobacterium sp.]|uniref:Sigma-54 interacting regulator n=1 Tax=uncultured Desulfobacterium sp. TaxID=201089 RepID=A0A445MRA6_9BACT|nr:Sigma-54 interacting regulator [uncultured Desulfobacterium sp.]
MNKILTAWIGFTDIRASKGLEKDGLGPIGQAVQTREFDEINLISNLPSDETNLYVEWLESFAKSNIRLHTVELTGPTQFSEIYKAATAVISDIQTRQGKDSALTFHLSPGTPAMAAVWIFLAKTRSPAELIESSLQEGVKTVSIPFDISAEFIPDLLRKSDDRLEHLAKGLPPKAPEFSQLIHRSSAMKRVILKAQLVAPRSVSVLIEGETGTGKELLARAIHEASPRREKPFVAVNCGAIPNELLESELFGHEKGAFTGAEKQKKGYFEAASEGTLFLDEIGELPISAQVKLLRALQEKEINRIGSTQLIKFNARIIAATHRDLMAEIAGGRFREDLFYRIAVAVLKLPPLRERSGDVSLIIERVIEQINEENADEPGYIRKKISPAAKNVMLNYDWPGNVRELQNTLMRAAIWSTDKTIDIEDIREAMIPIARPMDAGLLNRPLKDGINLPKLMEQLAQHYLKRALQEANGNKTKATELVGLANYQTFSNWMKKYDVD